MEKNKELKRFKSVYKSIYRTDFENNRAVTLQSFSDNPLGALKERAMYFGGKVFTYAYAGIAAEKEFYDLLADKEKRHIALNPKLLYAGEYAKLQPSHGESFDQIIMATRAKSNGVSFGVALDAIYADSRHGIKIDNSYEVPGSKENKGMEIEN